MLDSNTRIIFEADDGSTSVITPADLTMTVEEIMERNGLTGRPYQVVDAADIPEPVPTPGQVDAERDRRIAGGFKFAGVDYQSRPEDRENIMGASTAALAALMAGAEGGDYHWHGDQNIEFAWIAADNLSHPMDAATMFAFGKAAMAHKQLHIFAGRALKNMDPIPADFATNPAYWP